MHVTCYIHGTLFPKYSCHVHHEAPRAAGGGDDAENLIWLCANCHNLTHRVAQLEELGRSGEAGDLSLSAYPVPSQRIRFKKTVKEILTANAKAKIEGKRKAKAMVEIELSHEVYDKLKVFLNDHKTGNKRISNSKYIEQLIVKHLKQKGYF